MKYAIKRRFLSSIVYNSNAFLISDQETVELKNTGVNKSMVLPGYNVRNVRPLRRIELLQGDESKDVSKELLRISESKTAWLAPRFWSRRG